MTMQKVAWPITIVQSEKFQPRKVKNEFSAIPVMIPGRAIGRIRMNETASRPKKRKRWTANAAALPSRRATVVATTAALIERMNASRASWLCQADENHLVEKPAIGQLCTFEELNA